MVLFSYNGIYRDQTLSARITRGMFVASYNNQVIWASDFSQSAHRKGPPNRNPYRAAARLLVEKSVNMAENWRSSSRNGFSKN